MSIKIRWLGHASFSVTSSNKRIYLDPWIKGNPVCPIKIEDVDKADIVCVTHGHSDHLGDAFEIVKKTDAVLVCSPEIGVIADAKGIKYDGKNSYPLNIGGSVKIKDIEVVMTSALHTSDTWESSTSLFDSPKLITGSGSCGYVITFDDGIGLYYAGDTGLFGDMRLIGQIYAPHIAILPVGGKYNMGIREAAFAASFISPHKIIPMHHGTYPNQKADIDGLVELTKILAPHAEIVRIGVGEEYSYPA